MLDTMASQGILPPASPGHPHHPPAASSTISCFESVHSHDTEGSDSDCKLDNSRAWGLDSLSIDGKLLRQPADRGHRVDQETTAHA
uniref:Uncharacterized protein n=1 Tax=Oryza glumipatula TaxID=40148 RepID=A0A0D9YBV6_9ORYZ